MNIINSTPMQSRSDKEFLEQLIRTITMYLHQKYDRRELPDIISSCMNFHSKYRKAIEGKNKRQMEQLRYTPQGKAEKIFYEKLIKTIGKK